MSNEKDPIIWQRAWTNERCGFRVVRLRGAPAGTSAFVVERADLDSQRVPQWSETEDDGDRDEAISEALVVAHDELEQLRRQASAREVLPKLESDLANELGAALGYGGKEMSGRTWASLLADVRDAVKGKGDAAGPPFVPHIVGALWKEKAVDEPPWRIHAASSDGWRILERDGTKREVLRDTLNAEFLPCVRPRAVMPELAPKVPGFYPLRPELEIELRGQREAAKHEPFDPMSLDDNVSITTGELASLRETAANPSTRDGARLDNQIWRAIEAPTKSQLDDLDRTLRGLLDGVSAGAHRAAGLVQNDLERLKRDIAALEMKVAELVPRTTPDYKTAPRSAFVDGRCPNVSGRAPHPRCELEVGHLEQHCAGGAPAHFWQGFAADRERREAVIREHEAGYRDAPLDLATLRVPCALGNDEDFAEINGATLYVYDAPAFGSLKLTPPSARLLARALTQWADGAEKGAAK